MDSRSITGLIVVIVGFILFLVGALFIREGVLFFGFYSIIIIIIIIGVVIILNKSEDKIENINYSKIKGGKFK